MGNAGGFPRWTLVATTIASYPTHPANWFLVMVEYQMKFPSEFFFSVAKESLTCTLKSK